LCALQINIAQSFRRFVEAQISIENRITRIKYARYANRIPSLTALAGELFLGHFGSDKREARPRFMPPGR
jgi:hypothetical protein